MARNSGRFENETLTRSATARQSGICLGGGFFAMTEESGADADDGAAGGDGGGEVATHAHRKFAQGGAGFGREGVAEFAQGGERSLSDGGVVGKRRNGHEAIDAEMRFVESEIEQSRRVFEFGAKLGGIATGVDLKEDGERAAEFGGGAVEVIEKLLAIHTLDTVEVFGREAGLVGLEMTDELPLQRSSSLRAFGDAFLHTILAHGTEAGPGDVVGGFGGMGFRDGKKSDGGGLASGETTSCGDVALHLGEPVTKFVISREH